jgi:hypothetical protein
MTEDGAATTRRMVVSRLERDDDDDSLDLMRVLADESLSLSGNNEPALMLVAARSFVAEAVFGGLSPGPAGTIFGLFAIRAKN